MSIMFIGSASRTPFRVKRERSPGWRMPANTVYVGRPSRWGNPFEVVPSSSKNEWMVVHQGRTIVDNLGKREAQEKAVEYFKLWFCPDLSAALNDFRNIYGRKGFALAMNAPALLRGKNIACWCDLDSPCHGDWILEVANATPLFA